MALKVRAPELDGGLAWLNSDRPLTLRELRGSVVVLDFWTYCCINCMHVLPTLRTIEERHRGEPLVVIGVHSGKFGAEGDPDRIREAIERYGVEHPVVADDDMAIWSRFGIRSWPTLVIVRPDGTIAAIAPGEPDLDVLDAFITHELELARQSGTLSSSAPSIHAGPPREHVPLRYPGKASVLPDGRIAISDSGHHRVLVCAPGGEVLATVGSGVRGLADGPIADAAFDDPQGSCFWGGALYVADTRNHALRRVDLERGEVTTVAGTGELGRGSVEGRARAREVALRSPWDVCAVGEEIFVAMAGSHQIWRYAPTTGEIEVYAGTGVEALDDGAVRTSAWAQPSGLSERDGTLYVADSETSAVRAIDLAAGTVRTLIGQGLFDFGDDDGAAAEALLQHGLGVAAEPGGLLIADTYNGKIKRLTLPGAKDGAEVRTVLSGLNEPGSISVAPDGSWVIADTNAHRILRVVDGAATEIPVRGAPPPRRGALAGHHPTAVSASTALGWFTTLLTLPEGVGLGSGAGEVTLVLDAASGSELSDGAPLHVSLEVSRRSDLLRLDRDTVTLEPKGGAARTVALPVRVEPFQEAVVEAELVVKLDYVACDARNHSACVPGKVHARVPVRLLSSGGKKRLEFRIALPMLEL